MYYLLLFSGNPNDKDKVERANQMMGATVYSDNKKIMVNITVIITIKA